MIVSCPECHTLYRHRAGTRRRARCGACQAEVILPAARTYVVQPVGVPAFAGVASAPRHPNVGAASSPWSGSAEDTSFPRPSPAPFDPRSLEDARPAAARDGESIDRRLDEIVKAAGGYEAAEGTTLRAVLFGVGLGTIGGVAFAPGLFHAPWLGWAAGGVVGGTLGVLWSRLWGSRSL